MVIIMRDLPTFSSESEEPSSDEEEDDDEGHHEDLESDFRKLEMERGEQGQGRASLRSLVCTKDLDCQPGEKCGILFLEDPMADYGCCM